MNYIVNVVATRQQRGDEMYKIEEYRKKAKLTQEELATKAGISRATIARLERNSDVETTVGSLCAIADALGVDIKKLI